MNTSSWSGLAKLWCVLCCVLWCIGSACALLDVLTIHAEDWPVVLPLWLFPSGVALLTVLCFWRTRRLVLWHITILLSFAGFELLITAAANRGEQMGWLKLTELYPALGQLVALPFLWALGRKLNRHPRGKRTKKTREHRGRESIRMKIDREVWPMWLYRHERCIRIGSCFPVRQTDDRCGRTE